jgi:hypothetical protein
VRKSSIEQRGAGVVTTSGVLVTLLLALAGLATEASKTVVLPHAARWWLVAALIAFIVATLLALLTNIPLRYEAVTAAAISGRLDEKPIKSVPDAQRDIALTRAKSLADAKCKNGVKAWFLFAAITCEAIAVGLLGVAVCIVIAP